jgi:hypothetical protein
MKQNRCLFVTLALACVISLFLGCSQDAGGPNLGGEVKQLSVSVGAVPAGTPAIIKYYSLSTGEEVTGDDITSNKWDIAFSRTRLILTNSGVTAADLESGGKGSVWYTGKTVLSEAALGDQVEDPPEEFAILKDYSTDQKRYVAGMGAATVTTLNVMSYVGYRNEDDVDGISAATAFGVKADDPADTMPYLYDKKNYYASGPMGAAGPTWSSSGQVYIIRHGDGENYSKIQITYEYQGANADAGTPATDVWGIEYQNF